MSTIDLVSKLMFAILQDNSLSRSQLTSILGYTSKTSIDRIAQQIAGERALYDFYNRVCANPELVANEQSRQYFFQLSTIYGKNTSHDWLLLFKNPSMPIHPDIHIHHIETGEGSIFVSKYQNKKDLIIYVHGGISPTFIENLNRLIEFSGCHVNQYFRRSDTSAHLSKAIRSLFPILFSSNYNGYIYDDTENPSDIEVELPYNCMLISYLDDDEKKQADFLTFETDTTCLLMPVRMVNAMESFILKKLERYMLSPIVNNNLSALQNDYVKYALFCEKLEQNSVICQYKPDFGLEQVESSLVFRAIRDGSFLISPGTDNVFMDFIPIQIRRYKNSCAKKVEQYYVFKESALKSFAETGMMSDHFWGMRAFTPEERIAILNHLIKRAENELNYKLYLLEDENEFTDSEITLYEDNGLSIIKPHTSYYLDEGHSELLLESSIFCSSFKFFFIKELIPRYTRDQRSSLRCLKTIVESIQPS